MGKYPISEVCPSCGSQQYAWKYPEGMSFAMDRECMDCKTRYAPSTPRWAHWTFIGLGVLLIAFAVFCFVRPAFLGPGAQAFGGFTASFGLLATAAGWLGLRKS